MIISCSGNVGLNLLQKGQFFVLWSSVLQDFVVSLCLSSGEAVRCTNHLLPLLSFISVLPAQGDFLKRTDTERHVRAKFSRICAMFFLLLNTEFAKQALFHTFCTMLQFFSSNLICF